MFIFHESNNKSTPEWMSSRTKKTMIREQNNQPVIIKQEKELQVVNSKPPLLKKRTDKIASVLTVAVKFSIFIFFKCTPVIVSSFLEFTFVPFFLHF